MYVTFVRPILEYASVVWDGCSSAEIEKLEKVQLHAARIVTGLPIFASKESLYLETGWDPLRKRRENAKLMTMYKIHSNLVPQYLVDIIDNLKLSSRYSTRHVDDYTPARTKLELYNTSFFPDAIRKWNSLENDTKKSTSTFQFRRNIFQSNNSQAPKH